MYLAEHTINGRKKYVIRDSRYNPDLDCWCCRDLYDLGKEPWKYIVYPGGNSFYVQESVREQLADQGVEHDLCELEELLWKFIKKDIRQKIEPFYCRRRRKVRKTNKEYLAEEQVRVFDKRRWYYLRCGATDQRRVGSIPLRYFKALLQKSRDEMEQTILQMEKSLNPREYKHYIYIVFDLQRYFAGSSLKSVPQALDQDELDKYFIQDLCRLHDDDLFWAGFTERDRLHEYLVRYAVMFFDYEFDGESAWNEYLQNFINSKRFHKPPPPRTTIIITEIVEIFGISEEDLKAMSKSELTKLFRQKAHELHPDKGGEHDAFVRLAEAYKELLRRKG